MLAGSTVRPFEILIWTWKYLPIKKQILLSVNNYSHHTAPTSGCTYSDPSHSESAACSTTKHNAIKQTG